MDSALRVFWRQGYTATSMEDLVRASKVSRAGIYADFGGKRELFCACLERYQEVVVTPAFARVEAPDARLDAVEAFFAHHIAAIASATAAGRRSPGCLVANTMTEVGPHDDKVRARIVAHNERLERGFVHALRNEARGHRRVTAGTVDKLARFVVVSAHGLFSYSRSVSDPAILEAHVTTMLSLVRARLCATGAF